MPRALCSLTDSDEDVGVEAESNLKLDSEGLSFQDTKEENLFY